MNTVRAILGKRNARIIDVRTKSEYGISHFPGAENIPLDELPHYVPSLKQETKPMVFYCRSGNRSGVAVNFLHQQGFAEVYNGGGIDDMERLSK